MGGSDKKRTEPNGKRSKRRGEKGCRNQETSQRIAPLPRLSFSVNVFHELSSVMFRGAYSPGLHISIYPTFIETSRLEKQTLFAVKSKAPVNTLS